LIPPNQFFDIHSEYYTNNIDNNYFLNFIRSQKNENKKFLDIGGGAGIFASRLKKHCNELDVFIVDPSLKLLEKNTDMNINKFQGSLPNDLNLPMNIKFDYILMKEVLHHVTGKTIKESRALVIESIKKSKVIMADGGYLLIHELFYESFLYASFSRTLIFYLLKIQNKIHISFLPQEFILGLSVFFYTRTELENIFRDCGLTIVDSYKEDWAHNSQKYMLLLKNWGRILYILKRENLSDN
jgi:cyclopropane fatty-acyl-phospholipid synthase-like methyltransferase